MSGDQGNRKVYAKYSFFLTSFAAGVKCVLDGQIMTQKELNSAIRRHEKKYGWPSQFSLPCGATVFINAEYISAKGKNNGI